MTPSTAGPRLPAAPPRLSPLTEHYFRTLPCCGSWPAGTARLCSGRAGSTESGTLVQFSLLCDADGGVLEARFRAFGCPHVLAVCAWLAEQLPGRSLAALISERPSVWAAQFTVPAEKLGRLLVIEDALLDCAASGLHRAHKKP